MTNPTSPPPAPQSKPHLLSVMLEDYFHVRNFNRVIRRDQWYRFESRFEANTLKALDLLDRFNIKATFFVLGWIAEQQPELVREVAGRGHEIAARGMYHDRHARPMTAAEFRDDVRRTSDLLTEATGIVPIGYRAARRWKSLTRLWTLDVLAEEGFRYDASFLPTSSVVRREAWRRFPHTHQTKNGAQVWEFPLSTCDIGGVMLPVAGGNYFRQIPHTLLKHAVEHWHNTHDVPLSMYFHVWELDTEQPRITAASRLARMGQYRKLDKISWVLEDYFSRYNFTGYAHHLKLHEAFTPSENFVAAEHTAAVVSSSTVKRNNPFAVAPSSFVGTSPRDETDCEEATASSSAVPVTVVIPCFNEATTLRYVANTLTSVERALLPEYKLDFIFVNDCSTDTTWYTLNEVFKDKPNYRFIHHETNQGVAAAIRTGIINATTDIVCSMDCDCSYDPHELRRMIPLLADGVDMVTASPYHPQGAVRNVPEWRLGLSRASSFLYRQTLRQKLYTYTSCFRVYRRSAIVNLNVTHAGFLGIAETLGLLDLNGSRIVEHPATLEVRLFGQSKMKIARTIAGHLKLLSHLARLRFTQHRRQLSGNITVAPSNNEAHHTPQLHHQEVHPSPVITQT